jgi:uncharacterized membrane protein (DUF2068 family)
VASATKTKKHGGGLMVIAAYKLVKSLALLALGFGALHYMHRDVAAAIAHWINLLRVDPHNHYLLALLERVGKLDETKMRELSVGTFFYAALFLCEGTGLALRQRWAEYLTIVSTASLMPVEVYEIYIGPSAAKLLILAVNVLVVAYLVRELRRTHAKHAAKK